MDLAPIFGPPGNCISGVRWSPLRIMFADPRIGCFSVPTINLPPATNICVQVRLRCISAVNSNSNTP